MFKQIIRDPLFSFLMISIGIFIYYSLITDPEAQGRDTIILTDSDIDRLVDVYRRTWSSPPDSVTLRRLIDQEIRNEIFYSEGLQMNLDHNDEIIRRRLVQKYEFLIKDLSNNTLATDDQLQSYYQDHVDRYMSQALFSFRHYYFSPDKTDQPKLEAQSFYQQVIDGINPKDLKSDPMHIGANQTNKSINQLMQSFGKRFSERMEGKMDTGWQAPIESGYGWHVVNLIELVESAALSFEQVKEQVTQDYRNDQLSSYNERIYDALRSNYDIRWDLQKWSGFIQ